MKWDVGVLGMIELLVVELVVLLGFVVGGLGGKGGSGFLLIVLLLMLLKGVEWWGGGCGCVYVFSVVGGVCYGCGFVFGFIYCVVLVRFLIC